MTETGSDVVERLRNPPFVKFHDSEFGHDYRVAREDDLRALLAVVEAAQRVSDEWDGANGPTVFAMNNLESKLAALRSQASDEGKSHPLDPPDVSMFDSETRLGRKASDEEKNG
jgi:hypothetical protein